MKGFGKNRLWSPSYGGFRKDLRISFLKYSEGHYASLSSNGIMDLDLFGTRLPPMNHPPTFDEEYMTIWGNLSRFSIEVLSGIPVLSISEGVFLK